MHNNHFTQTDSATRGGQIFSHVWRMKMQNLSLLFTIFMVSAALMLIFLLYVRGWNLWSLCDVYLSGWCFGNLKLTLLNPFKVYVAKPFSDLMFELARLMGRPARHLDILYVHKKDLLTHVYAPSLSKIATWRTFIFVDLPWVKKYAAHYNHILMHSVLFGGVVTMIMSVYFHLKGKKTKEDHVLDGDACVDPKTLARKIGQEAANLKLSPEIPFVEGTQTQHTILIGSTGQGKTNRMVDILRQLRAQGHKVVVLDITGEFTSLFFREKKDILLNPLDSRSHPWDVWCEDLLTHEYDAYAASMVPENLRDPVWHESARKLLATTALLLKDDEERSMQEILDLSCNKPVDREIEKFYENSPAAVTMQVKGERTTMSVRMTLSTSIQAFSNLEKSDDPFSITKWMKEEDDSWLFLTALPSQRNTLAPLLASWFNFAFLGLERCGPQQGRQIWFVIDELPGLRHRIDALPRMVAEGRKYGACCLFGLQNKAQLDHLFGQHDAKAILSNCATKVIFRTPEASTAQYISDTLGRIEVQESNENISLGAHQMRDGVNLSANRRIKPVVSATDIMSLNRFEAYVSLPGNLPIAKVTFPLVTPTPICEAFTPKSTVQGGLSIAEEPDKQCDAA